MLMKNFLIIILLLTSKTAYSFGILTSQVKSVCDMNMRHAKSYCESSEKTAEGATYSKCDGFSKVEVSFHSYSKMEVPKYGEHQTCKVTKTSEKSIETTVYSSFGTKIVSLKQGNSTITRIFSDDGYLTMSRVGNNEEPLLSFYDYNKSKESYLSSSFEKGIVFEFVKKNTFTLSTERVVAQTK